MANNIYTDRPAGMPSGQVQLPLGGVPVTPKGTATGPRLNTAAMNRVMNTNPTGLQIPKESPGSKFRQQADQPVQQGLALPAEPKTEVDKIKEELKMAVENGASAYVQTLAKVDPDTAEAMKTQLIRQKTSLMKGHNDTFEMDDKTYGQYLKDTVKLAEVASDIQSVPPAERAVRYQQRLEKLQAIDPNAPLRYDSNYVATAAIEGRPIKNAMQGNEALSGILLDAVPLNNRDVEAISPGAAKEIGNTDAKLIFKNAAGTYKVFESLDKDGNKVMTVDDNGKVKKLGDNLNVVPGMTKDQIDTMNAKTAASRARREGRDGEQGNTTGLSQSQQVLLDSINSEADPIKKSALVTLFDNDIKQTVEAKDAAIKQQYKLAQMDHAAEVSKLQGGATSLAPATKTLLQKDYYSNAKVLQKMQSVSENFKEEEIQELLTAGGKFKTGIAGLADWVGAGASKLPGLEGKTASEWVNSAGKLKGPIFLVFQDFRTKITGAAAANQELDRLEKGIINGNMNPEQFKTAFNNIIRIASEENKMIQTSLENNRLPPVYSVGYPMPEGYAEPSTPMGTDTGFDPSQYSAEDIQ